MSAAGRTPAVIVGTGRTRPVDGNASASVARAMRNAASGQYLSLLFWLISPRSDVASLYLAELPAL